MSHNLLIDFDIEEDQVLTGEPFHFKIIVKNIGEKKFPGGIFSHLGAKFTSAGTIITEEIPNIPPIKVQDSYETKYYEAASNEEGQAWIEVRIKSKDDTKVVHYIDENFETKNKASLSFLVKKYEDYRIIKLLEEILAELKNLKRV